MFRVIGGLALTFGVMQSLAVVANLYARSHGGHDLRPLVPLTLASIAVGVGMLFYRVWLATMLVFILGSAAFVSSMGVPLSLGARSIAAACLLLAGSAVLVRAFTMRRASTPGPAGRPVTLSDEGEGWFAG